MSATKNEAGLWEVNIDDKKYEFEKWGGEEAVDATLDLFGILGVPAGQAVSSFFSSDGPMKAGLDSEMNPEIIGKIIEKLSDRVGSNKAICKELIKKLSSHKVSCDGKKIGFDQHYRDSLGHLMKVVRAGIEVQFSSFFGESSGSGGFLQGAVALMNRV